MGVGGSEVAVATVSVGVTDGRTEAVSVTAAPDAGVDVAVGSAGSGVSVDVGGGGSGVSVDVGGGGSGVSVGAGGGRGVSVGISSEVVRGEVAVPSMPLPYPSATTSTAPAINMTDNVTISRVRFRVIDYASAPRRIRFCLPSRRGGTERVARLGAPVQG